MLQIFHYQNGELLETEQINDHCWINLTIPTHHELIRTHEELDIPLELLTAALDPEERPRFETDEDVMLLIIRIPIINDDDSGIPYITRPLGILIQNDIIITVCTRENTIINDFIYEKIKNFTLISKVRFILQIFYRTVLKYLRSLKDIDNQTNDIEKELTEALKNQELIRLLNYEKSLVFFTTSLKSNQIVMERFKRTTFFRNAIADDRELLDDIIIDNAQAIEMAHIYTNILSGLMDTFASVISNNLNNVMRTLTKITIVLMLPTLITSFYGMNVNLPIQENPYAFAVITIVCILASVIAMTILTVKRRF